MEVNKIYNGDCRKVLKNFKDNSIDMLISSPPYNVGIDYDVCNDNLSVEEYEKFTEEWLSEAYRVLKDTGRIAINMLYECKMEKNEYRMFVSCFYWNIMKKIGFNWKGLIDLNEKYPHHPKRIAVGSFMDSTSPYIYNPKECIILACKGDWKKPERKKSYFNSHKTQEDKDLFMTICNGHWEYRAETSQLTKANFSVELPTNLIKLLAQENDIILDPFFGSGTTGVACKKLKGKLDVNYIGIELSEKYCKIAMERIDFTVKKNTNRLF